MTRRTFHLAAAVAALFTLPAIAQGQRTSQEKAPMKNIAQIAVESGSFNTLVAALKAAGLVETLQGAGPFTVFAPTDAAFEKLPEGTVTALLADREKLTAILTYHVIAGKVMAADIVSANGATPSTVNGSPLDIAVRGGRVYVNGTQVVTADIVASNGVIHVIDGVLLPSMQPATSGR
jgi:uncharacterized surface protein with fasciclin (FAS1) repeats